ncbi:DNA adenine methylase [Subtercola sp. Z020]|uniref:DNA adenine methylase n=1 Tax=Subtercola sp. Z020 TaxID=2080582 RepID=UPI0011B09AF2|nr:DNA adenine methylase [Subtercola sp. Z020]
MPDRPKPLSPLFLQPARTRRHADFVLAQAPSVFGSYVEPFLESGAVALAFMERFAESTFRLSSDDPEVVNAWQVLQADADRLVACTLALRDRHDRAKRAALAGLRGDELVGMEPVDRAARLLYLRGSAGRDPAAVAFDETNVRRVSALLAERDVRFDTRAFYAIVAEVAEEDLVFLDPPFGPGAPASLEREVRSLVGTVTARGAYLLAPSAVPAAAAATPTPAAAAAAGASVSRSAPGLARTAARAPAAAPLPAVYAAWNTMSLAADRGDGDEVWANRTLERARRR